MVIDTTIIKDGIEYDYHYSDLKFKIEREGVPYDDAIDPLNSGRIYTETDIPIEPIEPIEEDDEATEDDYINALRELGVEL